MRPSPGTSTLPLRTEAKQQYWHPNMLQSNTDTSACCKAVLTPQHVAKSGLPHLELKGDSVPHTWLSREKNIEHVFLLKAIKPFFFLVISLKDRRKPTDDWRAQSGKQIEWPSLNLWWKDPMSKNFYLTHFSDEKVGSYFFKTPQVVYLTELIQDVRVESSHCRTDRKAIETRGRYIHSDCH